MTARRALTLSLALVAVLAFALGLAELALFYSGAAAFDPPWVAVLFPVMTWVYVGAGCFAWARRPGSRIGALLIVGGLAWLAAGLLNGPVPALEALGLVVATLPIAIVMHLLLAFPSGRLHGRAEHVTAALGYVVCLPLQAPLYLFAPVGPLRIADEPGLVTAGEWVQRLVGAGVVLAICVLLVRRMRALPHAQRRVLAPLTAYGVLAILAIPVGAAVADLVDVDPLALAFTQLSILALVPLAFVVAASRGGFARTADIEELSGWLGAEDEARPSLTGALRTALGDASVELLFRVAGQVGWVTAAGARVPAPVARNGRGIEEVTRADTTIGALVYDAALVREPDVRAAAHVVALALDRERLTVELRASRTRLVEAGDAERRRIARDLHDGLQSRLVMAGVRAGLAGEEGLRIEIDTALDELRALVAGLMPAALTERGLPAAVEGLADRMPVPVTLHVDGLDQRLPPAVESTGYFVVSEALANAVKHAGASRLTVTLSRNGADLLRIGVHDDGVGFEGAAAGTGTRSLADRVEALGGRLRIVGTNGTLVEAELPCAS